MPSAPAPGGAGKTASLPRLAVAAASALGWFALILQLALTIQLTLAQGRGALEGIWIYLDYFTVITNALAASALTAATLTPRRANAPLLAQPESVTALAACILIVGLVYNLVLRSLWNPHGWTRVADELLHVVMPVLFLGYWQATAARQPQQLTRLAWWMLYPLGYLAYVLARGALDGRYPYPFLDPARLGYASVLLNSTLVGAALMLTGSMLFATSRWQVRRMTAMADETR